MSFYERNIKVSLMTIFAKKTAARKFRKEGSRFQSETTKRIRYRLYLIKKTGVLTLWKVPAYEEKIINATAKSNSVKRAIV